MKSVLTVDDSPSIRQMVKLVLSQAGYEVHEAVDGLEGLEKAKSKPVQMIVTDLNMPRMDGITMVRELRKAPRLQGRADRTADDGIGRKLQEAGQGSRCHRLDHETLQAGTASRCCAESPWEVIHEPD